MTATGCASPLGKLHNDRYVPLHPHLVELLADWTAANRDHIRPTGRLLADEHGPLNRDVVARSFDTIARRAGIDHVHPHRLRHTLATQAINRGMRSKRSPPCSGTARWT